MTTPDIDDPSSYGMPDGGFADAWPVTDPTTDQGSAGANEMMVSCANMTHTAVRCWARMVGNVTTPTIQSLNGHDAMWGSGSSIKPTPAHSSTGVYTLTWPTTITDALGVLHTTNLRWARVSCEDADGFFRAAVTSPNVVTITCKTTAVALNDFVGNTFFVQAG
jgi:hypothetical protein